MDPKAFQENIRRINADLELRFGRRNMHGMMIYTQLLKRCKVKVPQVQPLILPASDYIPG